MKFSRIFRCVCLRKFINANPALYQEFQTELEIRIIQPNHPPYEYYITILHKHRSACFVSFKRFFMTCRIQLMLISLLLFFFPSFSLMPFPHLHLKHYLICSIDIFLPLGLFQPRFYPHPERSLPHASKRVFVCLIDFHFVLFQLQVSILP